ncbi:alkaline serine exoprotease A [Allomyces macrogynus ATCC 38327]|uniref:Alkaline serine exoprotease A n=1 Tax=Allomyces macrogynus (strain ATCC 38327) TaxID=578462 RepID=A0A0L0T166_ALLM3|nr:alkaline serine exoprotease A [Allomyces macrogynus ATCC 38327]|eukprot:KNE68476.1 alkaline serine exoprotease A [Allomyces macrogynus ATCC 38327]
MGTARTLRAQSVLGPDGSGSTAGVISGINWVTAQAKAKNKTVVANLSLGGAFSAAVNNAVKAATSAGVVFVVAAGGDNTSACNTSPASEPSAVTVAATTKTDARASSSNYGTCIDIFAPGTAITSTWINNGTNTLSGTSMAAAHVAGVAALLVGQNPTASVATIVAELIANSTPNVVQSAGAGSPNKLAYVKQ